MKLNLPSKITIGGIEYEIELTKDDLGDGASGRLDRTKGKILINQDLCLEERNTTFLHECIHACNSELEENIVDPLAVFMYQIFKQLGRVVYNEV